MSDTNTPAGSAISAEQLAELDAAHATINRLTDPDTLYRWRIRLQNAYPGLSAAVKQARADLATWKARAGEKWSQHDLDRGKKIGELTHDLLSAYDERDGSASRLAKAEELLRVADLALDACCDIAESAIHEGASPLVAVEARSVIADFLAESTTAADPKENR